MKKAITLFISAIWATTSFGNNPQQLAANFNLTMNTCPEKIWDNYSWKALKVFLVYQSLSKVYEWDGSTNQMVVYELDQTPDFLQKQLFSFFKANEIMSLSLNIDWAGENALQLGVHEGFHFLGQENWHDPNTRGSGYPLKYEPRYLRRMLFEKMLSAIHSGKEEDIRKAKYWYQQWSDQYPEESKMNHDSIEGVAEYASLMALAIVNTGQGCAASDEEIKNQVLPLLPKYRNRVSKNSLELDDEGYALGSLATLLLRFTEGTKSWQSEIAGGKNPLEVLFQNYSLMEDADDNAIKKNFMDAASEKNETIGILIDDDLASYLDQDYIRLNVPLEYFSSALFVVPSSLPDTSVIVFSKEHQYISSTSVGKVTLKANTVVFLGDMERESWPSCNSYIALVHKDDVKRPSQGIFHIESEHISAFFVGTEKTNASGMTFLCPE